MPRTLFRLSLLVVLAAAPARAQAPVATLDTTLVLPDVTVTATRRATRVDAAPARVTVLDGAAVDAAAARSVADLLEARSGAFIRRYGGGGLSTLSLRGTAAAQTLVLLDGHRIADPQLGQLDLSLLPTLLLSSVEVMHGSGSPLYGTDGLGGVVNLRSRAPSGAFGTSFTGGVGAFGERTGGVRVSGGGARLSGVVLAGYEASENDYPYLDRARFPPARVARRGADRRSLALYGSARYAAPGGDLRVAGWYNDAERGLPSAGTGAPAGERQWDEQLRVWADYEARRRWGRLRVGGLVQDAALRYVDPHARLDETGRTRVASAEAEVQTVAVPSWLLAAGVSGGFGRARHPSLAADAEETHVGAFVHAAGHHGPVLVYPALRADVYDLPDGTYRAAVNPRLGVNVRPRRGGGLRLKASAGRSFRVPTFNQRYWQPGGRPDLRPEHGWTYDAGAAFRGRRGVAEVTVFSSVVHDQIVWAPTEAGFWAPDNTRRVWSRGVEVSLEGRAPMRGRLAVDGGLFYTFTAAQDRSDTDAPAFGNQVRYVPRQQAKAFAGARWGAVDVSLHARYAGRRFVTVDGTQALPPYVLLDARVGARVDVHGTALGAALVVENALDRDYRVVQAQPMPPRHVRLQLTVDIE